MDAGTRTDRLAAAWLARRDSGRWNARHEARLQAWLDADASHRVAFLRVQSAWEQSARLKALQTAQAADDRITPDPAATIVPLRPHREPIPVPRPRIAPRRTARVAGFAAALAVGVLAVGVWWRSGLEQADYRTPVGELETVALSDGSRATLASDTRIRVRLDRGQRRVSLERGEGFFEVATDPERAFVVDAAGHQVVAVGTAFSVRRLGDGIRVVVTEGTVRLVAAGGAGGPATLLPAGSIATTGGDGVLVRHGEADDALRLLDWRDGMLAFQDTSLAAAAAEFNRYNTRRIEVGDEAVAALRIGGSFRWDRPDTFVALLEAGFPVCADEQAERIVLLAAGDPACR